MLKKTLPIWFSFILATTSFYAQSVRVAAAQMNTLYIGVDNPVSITCAGISLDSLKIRITGGKLKKVKKGYYKVRVSIPGEVVITVSKKNRIYSSNRFIAKRIPDPLPALGTRYTRSDTISTGLFKAQMGITLTLPDFDFDIKCKLLEYKVTLIADYHDTGAPYIRSAKNQGIRFGKKALDVIREAEAGDIILFSDFKALCPGDEKERTLNALMFFMEYTPDD